MSFASYMYPLDTLEIPKLERSIGIQHIMNAYNLMKMNNLKHIFIKNHRDSEHNLTTWNLISFSNVLYDKQETEHKNTFLVKIKSTISKIVDISLIPMERMFVSE